MAVVTFSLSSHLLDSGHKAISFGASGAPQRGGNRIAAFPQRRSPVAKKLYVGNLSYDMADSDLQTLFEQFGQVQSVQIIMDRDTGRSKGFGFVEMGSPQEAQAAIDGLNGKEVN